MEVETLQTMNHILALGGVFGIVIIFALLLDMWKWRFFEPYILEWGMVMMLTITLISVGLTLVYSEIVGIVPCGFCWFERVFMYPQILIIAAGIYFKDKLMPRYVLILSSIGLLISLYHHYIQMGGSQFITCPTSGTGADCAKRFLFEFGFVTFPLLAAVAFGLLAVISIYLLRSYKKNTNSSRQEG